MRKPLLFTYILIVIFFTACHTPSYTFSRQSSNTPVKFHEGRYLLNTRDIPEALRAEFEEILTKQFSEYLGEKNITLVSEASGIILPPEIPMLPDKNLLDQLKMGTASYLYLINIRTNVKSDDVDVIQVGNLDPSDKNIVSVGLEVIDLQIPGSIYYQQIRSELSDRDDNKDFSFAVGTETMLKKSFKKIMKRIDKNQIQ